MSDRRARLVQPERLTPPQKGEMAAIEIPTVSGLRFLLLPAGEEYPDTIGAAVVVEDGGRDE